MVDLSIIIVNWNTRELLRKCLQSVFNTVSGLDFDVWVVDNGSTDDSVEMVREVYPQVKLIENPENVGFALANNQALQICVSRYLLLLNSDAFPKTGAINAMVAALDVNLQAGIAGAKLEYPGGRAQRSYGRQPTLLGEVSSLLGLDKLRLSKSSSKQGGSDGIKFVGAVSGACMLIRRAVLDRVGLLDERFFMFSEEVDLCKRAWMAGWKVVHVPQAVVVHLGGGSTGISAERILRLYRAKVQFFTKHRGVRAGKVLWVAMKLTSLVKVCWYAILWVVSLGTIQKSNMWYQVAHGLRQGNILH